VDALLEVDRVAVNGVIAAELVRGCQTEAERRELETALEGVVRLETSFAVFLAAGREIFALRRKGITVSLTDAVIAAVSRESGCPLYTLDADFDRFAGLVRYPKLRRSIYSQTRVPPRSSWPGFLATASRWQARTTALIGRGVRRTGRPRSPAG